MREKPLALRIDEELLSKLDEARGDVPRTTFVVRALESALWLRDVRPPPGHVAANGISEKGTYSSPAQLAAARRKK